MIKSTEFQKLGEFLYRFQIVEAQLEEIIILLANADDELVEILIAELDFSRKLRVVDVMFSRFVDIKGWAPEKKREFHKVVLSVTSLSVRRNELVHSKYRSLLAVNGDVGLLRTNARLKPNRGIIDRVEEEIFSGDLDQDFLNVDQAMNDLEQYRLQLIDAV